MKASEFNNFAKEFTGLNITIWRPKDKTKWSSYIPLVGNLEPSTKYGICIGREILYDFKTTKKIDTFLKSFVNQHINKYELKQVIGFENGEFIYPKKEEVIKKYKNNHRVNKYFFYTTLYGIGMFSFFSQSYIDKVTKPLKEYLESKKIKFYNEYSDAGWAYRFVINKNVELHNELLENFDM